MIPVRENRDQRVESSESPNTNLQSLISSHLPFTQHDLLNRAADYFAQARKPRTEWKKLDDLAAQLAEFELCCEAGEYDRAANVLSDIDYNYLILWGYYHLSIGLYKRVAENIQDTKLRTAIIINLASTQHSIGETNLAVKNYEEALSLSKEINSRYQEGAALTNLGNAYAALGDTRKAIEFHKQALVIDHEMDDHEGEGIDFGSLASAYDDLGDVDKAIKFEKQSLVISREIGNRESEEMSLGRLGVYYEKLGDARKSIEFYEQALVIAHEIGDRSGECIGLENIGEALLSTGEYQKAQKKYQQAIQIADEISFLTIQQSAREKLVEFYLFQNDLVNARATIEAALQYDVPLYNHDVTTLHGIIALRQGERETAQEAFTKSIAQADEILAKTPDYYSALDAKGLALCGLALCEAGVDGGRLTVDGVSKAMEAFRKARKIAPHAGVVKSVLRLFDELVKCDEEGVLKDVRGIVAGNGV